jgi:hypothetical protein
MADLKISQLTAATTPVAGTEVLPIVQSSATKQLSIANLTPGLSTITAAKGGTGQTSYAVGDLLYANTTTTLARLADVATGSALISGGVGVAPSWGAINLATTVSGVLPVANSLLYYNTGVKSMSTGTNYDWYSIDFGSFSGRPARVEVVFGLASGGGGTRIWYRNSLVLETGGATLTETNLDAVNGSNGTLSFVLSGATLTVRTTTTATGETARMAILVEGYEMTSARITVL